MEKGDIETYLTTLTALADFDKLPQHLTAPALDEYASWLSMLTQVDMRERGAFVHFDIKQLRLIYPSNPHVGDRNSGDAVYGPRSNRFYPFVRSHSHPDNTCFSPHDLKRAIGSKQFIAELLGTEESNYLVLRTEQTATEVESEIVHKVMSEEMELYQNLFDKLRDIFPSAVREGTLPKDYAEYLDARYQEEEYKEFGSDIVTYMMTIATALRIADEYKLGFYKSNKRGLFARVDASILNEIHARLNAIPRRILSE